MTQALSAAHVLALCLYASAAAVFVTDFEYDRRRFQLARLLSAGGFLLLTLLLLGRIFTYRYVPLLTFHETLLYLAWVSTLALMIMDKTFGFKAVYLFGTPLAFAVLFASVFFTPVAAEITEELRSPWLTVHILSAITAYGAFAVSFVTSLMYLLVDRRLKQKKITGLTAGLPSLDSLDYYIYRLASAGLFLLTVSIFLGAVWANNVWGSYWRWDPKEIWAAVTWTLYAAYLHTRLMSGWQGRRVAMLSSLGFVAVFFNYVVVRFFFTGGLHRFF